MLFVADVGNTNIVLAVHDGTKWTQSWRIRTDCNKTSDEYFVTLKMLFDTSGLKPQEINKAVVSSVVPNLTMSVQKNIYRMFGIHPIVVSNSVEAGLDKKSLPVELGSDLLCNLAYAHHLYPNRSVMTIDFGTALTFSTVDEKGYVKGVAILPGLITAVNSLFASTAQLPQVELKLPETAVGRNSTESIRAGVMYGYSGVVEKLISETEKEIGEELVIIVTGGLSATISPLLKRVDRLDKYHTLNGLKFISDLN
jgi:pantothenate kinase, type III